LNSTVRNGDSRPRTSFTNHVGTGSSWHVLVGAELISLLTSSSITADHSESSGVFLNRTSYNGVVAVAARTESTLLVKKVANLKIS